MNRLIEHKDDDQTLIVKANNGWMYPGQLNTFGGQSQFSARDAVAALFRRKWMVLTLFLTIVTATVALTLRLPDQYESRMKILVKNARADVVVTPERTNGAAYNSNVTETQINSEIALLSSRDLLKQVVINGGLPEKDASVRQAVTAAESLSLDKSVRQLERDLLITPVKKADIIQVSYAAKTPEAAASVLQRLADLYLEKHLKLHRPPGTYEFFKTQATQYEEQLRDAEANLAAFRQKMNFVSLEQEKSLNLQKMAEARSALMESEASVNETAERMVEIQQQLRTTDPRVITQRRAVPNQSSVERLNTILVELQNRRTQLLTKFRPEDRFVKEVDQQIADTTAALEKASKIMAFEQSTDLNPLRQTLEAELNKAKLDNAGQQARRVDLARQVQRYQASLTNLGDGTTTHDDLVRRVKAAEENYQLYAKKQEEARIADALDQQKITNVSIAEAPTVSQLPSRPNRPLNIVLGLFIAGFVSLGSALGAEFFRDTVHTPRELESLTGGSVLATIPTQYRINRGIEEADEEERERIEKGVLGKRINRLVMRGREKLTS